MACTVSTRRDRKRENHSPSARGPSVPCDPRILSSINVARGPYARSCADANTTVRTRVIHPVHAAQGIAARTVALARVAPLSLPAMAISMVSMASSSLSADVKHKATVSTSGASSSIHADTRGEAKVAVFEALGTHSAVHTKRVFAMVAAFGSRAPRPCRRWMCYCIVVSGTTCTALVSRSAYGCMEWRGLGEGQEWLGVVVRARLSHHASGAWQVGSSPRFWYRGAAGERRHGPR